MNVYDNEPQFGIVATENVTVATMIYQWYTHVGIYTGDATPEEQSLFITEKHCFHDLVSGLGTPCPCGMTRNPWTLESMIQVCT